MLKMLKYEYRRALAPLFIIFILFGFEELYFLISTAMQKETHTTIATSLFVMLSFGCYIFVLIYGIVSYNRDLKNKEGYLVFMAPISSFQILGAKLLSILLTGITLVGAIFLFGSINYSFAASVYHFEGFIDFLKMGFESLGTSLASIVGGVLGFIIAFLIEFFMTVTIGYLAISLGSTVLQNKKIKSFASFVLFIVLTGVVNGIAVSLPNMKNTARLAEVNDLSSMLLYMAPQLGVYLLVAVLCYIGSSFLLEKKISL